MQVYDFVYLLLYLLQLPNAQAYLFHAGQFQKRCVANDFLHDDRFHCSFSQPEDRSHTERHAILDGEEKCIANQFSSTISVMLYPCFWSIFHTSTSKPYPRFFASTFPHFAPTYSLSLIPPACARRIWELQTSSRQRNVQVYVYKAGINPYQRM